MDDANYQYFESEQGKDHAIKLLDNMNVEYRNAEKYLHISLAILLGLLAFMWKEIDITVDSLSALTVYSAFILLWGTNLGIGLIYIWYLGVGISICDFEKQLTWLHVRPMFQINMGVCNAKFDKKYLILLSPILLPFLSGFISAIFFVIKFVLPIVFNKKINVPYISPIISIILIIILMFFGLIMCFEVTNNFRNAIKNNFPSRNYEMKQQEKNKNK